MFTESSDVRNFFTPVKGNAVASSNIRTINDLHASKPTGTMSKNKGSATYVIGDPSAKHSPKTTNGTVTKSKSSGESLGSKNSSKSTNGTVPKPKSSGESPKPGPSSPNINEQVRNIWASKFPLPLSNSTPFPKTSQSSRTPNSSPLPSTSKKRKLGDGVPSVLTECPFCDNLFDENSLEKHKETCGVKTNACPVCEAPVRPGALEEHLNVCLSDSIPEDAFDCMDTDEVEESNNAGMVPCPVCAVNVLESQINQHIDVCLNLKMFEEEFNS